MDPKPPSGRGFPWLMATEAVLGRGEGPATPGVDTPAHPGGGLSSALTPPLPGRARGWVFLEEGVMGRARGFLRPSPEAPVGRSAGSDEEEMPALEATPGISRDPGPSLASMFRGLGLDPSRAWGRGAAPVGRAAPASEEQSPGLREESVRLQGRGFFLGRGESPGSGPGREPPAQQISTEPSSDQQIYTEPSSDQQIYTEPSSDQQIYTEPSGAAHQGVEVEKLKERLNKAGSAGTLVDLGSNLVPISCKYELVYQYHVTFTPSVESRGVRFSMMKEARAVTGEVMAFDGSILYLPRRLEEELHFKALRKTDEQEIDVKIQLTKVLPPTSDLCVPFYNVLLRRVMKILGLKLVGRNFYNPDSAVILSKHRLQLWPGFSTCIKQTDGGLYLAADVSHKVLRNDSVLNIMNVLYHESGERFQDDCTKELVGAVILTRYNNCTYRVDNIDWSKSPKDTFTMSNGTVTTFVDYYRNHYGITIKELDQPLLVSRPREKLRPRDQMAVERGDVLLVPELSFMTGIPEKMKKDFRSMKDVTMHTISGPKQHAQSIRKLLQDITASEEARSELERWGLGVGQALLTTCGRILPRETICMKAVSFPTTPSVDWSREVTRDPPISSVPSDHWVVLYPRRAAEQAQELVSTFSRTAGPLGITLSRPQSVELQDDRTDTYVKSIHTLLTSQPHIQLVVCIVTGTRDDLYGAIKKLCCLQYPVPSQVVNARTISHPHKLRSIAQKILLQINCKLGGELWSVSVPLKQLMVIGVDVHHDISKKSRSVLGFVASLNSSMTRWYSKAYFQMPHEEIISGFRVCLLSALQKYYQVNHSFPGKIVVFRDGVSDGQMKAVEQYEIPQILECFGTVPDCQPKLTFIVVQKRISTTLYSCGADDEDIRNATPGTVLDHTVTNRDWVDFYLMAHSVRQGCALPTHYVTLYNTTGLSPDHLQRLTYKMCHLYWNWPGTIRVPAPCKYAHKLAFLCGQYLHREASGSLSEQLFYL